MRHGPVIPRELNYLSIDTEGSELQILRCSNFDEYHTPCLTREYNYTPARRQIHALRRCWSTCSGAGQRRITCRQTHHSAVIDMQSISNRCRK
jgi:hypothetical protein